MTFSSSDRQAPSRPQVALRPGTRLLREWQGITHEVLVTPQGFVHQSTTYRSISAVAKAITGITEQSVLNNSGAFTEACCAA